jgi:hypothetical protein
MQNEKQKETFIIFNKIMSIWINELDTLSTATFLRAEFEWFYFFRKKKPVQRQWNDNRARSTWMPLILPWNNGAQFTGFHFNDLTCRVFHHLGKPALISTRGHRIAAHVYGNYNCENITGGTCPEAAIAHDDSSSQWTESSRFSWRIQSANHASNIVSLIIIVIESARNINDIFKFSPRSVET